ncbi:paired box protein Pax-6-like [Coregonus clupeaformis]|uniref:paired box protein Pax-6-like n=1 Tax=Coregonus clupeaformis TaxID=59861 RepID=UPI001BE019EA|nr:paired box protein Pax-6-like [Coregonus clupeaformis]
MYEKLTIMNLQSGLNWTEPNNWYHDLTTVQTQHSTVPEGCLSDTDGGLGDEGGGGGDGGGRGGVGGGPVERDEGEESQLRLQLKRKLQRNRTSFTQEQIEALEKVSSQSAISYSCMLPPSPSTPQTFDSSAYPSHIPPPSSANSNTGLISPRVLVPVQLPGNEQSMGQNLGQYWARLQ